jgi:hypothetical protein
VQRNPLWNPFLLFLIKIADFEECNDTFFMVLSNVINSGVCVTVS